MADACLLVPMQLDVMVLNREAQAATPFLRFQPEYVQLRNFNDPEPPFPSSSSQQPPAGIYLSWTMPKAMRRGTYQDDGTTQFPYAPNRWLVVRMQAETGTVKAWILESDFLDAAGTHTQGSNPYVSGLQSDGTPVLNTLGRAFRFTPQTAALPSQPQPFLRAVGPGSVTFAAFSPSVQNVFAFTDNMTDLDDQTAIKQGTFTYYVAGWYSDLPMDPLQGTTWQPDADAAGTYVNGTLDWCVYAQDGTALPDRSLVHAMVSEVSWTRDADNKPAVNYPTDLQTTVKVAAANTAVDALSAMIRLFATKDSPQAGVQADLLEAFQYGLLEQFDQPGSAEALNMAIRQHWYGASSGGTLWRIVPRERTGSTADPAPAPPVLTPQQTAALDAVNAKQFELDRQQRILQSMQWTLYSLWWKYHWQARNDLPVYDPDGTISNWFSTQLASQIGIGVTCSYPNGTDPSQEGWYACKVQAQLNLVRLLSTAVNGMTAELQTMLDARQALKSGNRPQYFYPNDPVLLVTGLGRATNFDPQGTLVCRLATQTVTALTVNGTTYCTDGSCANDITARVPSLNDPNQLLPAGVQQLHTESVLLSPTLFAEHVLGATGQNVTAQSTAVQSAIAALPGPAAGGRFPPPAFACKPWQQPWVPLLLDWQVAVMQQPAYSAAVGQPTSMFNRENWQFDGTRFNWIGPTTASGDDFSEVTQMVLLGRTFVTPHLAFTLGDQLDQYVAQHSLRDPNLETLLEDVDGYVDGIQRQDMLSQRLSGLMTQLIQQGGVKTTAPSGTIAQLLGPPGSGDGDGLVMRFRGGAPMPFAGTHTSTQPNVWDFAPFAGLFLVVQKLTVIDTFGRSVDLRLANYSTSPQGSGDNNEFYFYPITGSDLGAPTALPPAVGRGVSTDPTQRMIQIPPRLVHDSQLALRLLANDGRDLDLASAGNPICGWVIPNHLDRSLMLYAPDGQAWGQLFLSQHANDQYVPVWQPDPTNPQAPQAVDAIPDATVSGMFQALAARKDNGAGFVDFMQVIDETLWTINPRGQRKDQNLAVLVGRPLAIVRAQLSLSQRGLRACNQDWPNTFAVDLTNLPDQTLPASLACVDGGLPAVSWPVRLGSQTLRNDGLIGYYADDPATPVNTFQTFNVVSVPVQAQSGYLRGIGQNGNYVQLAVIDDAITSPDPTQQQACTVTMLMDPRCSVHAFTGLLPPVTLNVPDRYTTAALRTMSYLFGVGPFLAPTDEVRLARPAETRGTWTWFDNVLQTSTQVSPADGKLRISRAPLVAREGWLKFTPNPPNPPTEHRT